MYSRNSGILLKIYLTKLIKMIFLIAKSDKKQNRKYLTCKVLFLFNS